jgi:hypothetical protein
MEHEEMAKTAWMLLAPSLVHKESTSPSQMQTTMTSQILQYTSESHTVFGNHGT